MFNSSAQERFLYFGSGLLLLLSRCRQIGDPDVTVFLHCMSSNKLLVHPRWKSYLVVYRYHSDTRQSGVIEPVIARIMLHALYLLIDK